MKEKSSQPQGEEVSRAEEPEEQALHDAQFS